MHKLPHEISEFIFKNYYGGYLSDVKLVKDKCGQVYYKVNLHENGVFHYLKFREDGVLVKHKIEPLLEEYYFE